MVCASVLCVNLRFVIDSAQPRVYFEHLAPLRRVLLASFSADRNLIAFLRADPRPQREPGQVRYFVGGAITIWLTWQTCSIACVLWSGLIPLHWGLGFAGTLAMPGLTCGLLGDRSTWVAALVAALAAVAAHGLPLKLNILAAIAAAVCAGLLVQQTEKLRDRWTEPQSRR